MKIPVVFTGGTIGSVELNGVIRPDPGSRLALINRYSPIYSGDVEFEAVTPYTILSENLSAKELNMLIDCVRTLIDKGCDGVIVAHGTDTLQYTAAALSFALGNSCPPVILVSSNYPLDDPRANGGVNFSTAVDFIKINMGRGVFVSYKNSGGVPCIFRGSRLFPHGGMSDEITCVGDYPYAFFDGSGLVSHPLYRSSENTAFSEAFHYCEAPEIAFVSCHPGDSWSYLTENCRAVLIKPYHSGTLDTENKRFVFFCEKAKERSVPVFVSGIHSGSIYESSEKYAELGLIPLKNTSSAAMYMKIWAAISRNADIAEYVLNPIADEFA
ncbi:MAG: asparaginase domain-containing protein [Clostridiales bacterium]|nr:asparaginase domain-containing protein [Clostridiales bacterium]